VTQSDGSFSAFCSTGVVSFCVFSLIRSTYPPSSPGKHRQDGDRVVWKCVHAVLFSRQKVNRGAEFDTNARIVSIYSASGATNDRVMVLLIVLGAWVVLGAAVAAALGRSVRRADQEELGSDRDWDLMIVEDVPHRSA